MPEILKLFHGSKVVPSVLEAGRFYHDVFGSWVYEATYLPYEDSNNSANLMGGDFSMEMLAPMAPLRRRGSSSVRGPTSSILRSG